MSRELKLKVITGIRSKATQYSVLVNPGTYTELFSGINSPTKCINMINTVNNISMIAHVEPNDAVEKGCIAIASTTHAQYLQAAMRDILRVSVVNNVLSITDVALKHNSEIILSPTLPFPMYVAPGYTVHCYSEYYQVVEGEGFYMCPYPSAKVSRAASSSSMTASPPASPPRASSSSSRKGRATRSYETASNKVSPFRDRMEMLRQDETINMDFNLMGIGGLQAQMGRIISQVLISRIMDEVMLKKYEVNHIKGILMFGPSGTGKTLIAKNIGKMIPNSVISHVNGPELSSKFVGESEANVRKLFDDAKSNPSQTHIIIFDEIDAIGKRRGEGTVHDDKTLNQLLTMIDGLDSGNNVLIIGITNRPDVLDPALTRAGRLECHIEIPLPTEQGREEILNIYLNPLRERKLVLGIDSKFWAHELDGYSGADIKSLIGRATNLALLRNCDINDTSIRIKKNKGPDSPIIHSDFEAASNEFRSTFSKHDNIVKQYVLNYPIEDSEVFEQLKDEIEMALSVGVSSGSDTELNSGLRPLPKPYIITRYNDAEEEKALVCHVAMAVDLPYVRYVSYNTFLGKTSSQNCTILDGIYHDCLQAERSVLILDSLIDVNDRALGLKVRWITQNPLSKGKQLVIIIICPT